MRDLSTQKCQKTSVCGKNKGILGNLIILLYSVYISKICANFSHITENLIFIAKT